MFYSRFKKGFTLVELTVVMAIVGVISTIGVSALLSARDNSLVDNRAEVFLTTVREAQNNAIAIKKHSTFAGVNLDTKVWMVEISPTNNNFYLKSLHASAGDVTDLDIDGSAVESKALSPVAINISGSRNINTPIYIAFATPFAKAYVIADYSGCESGSSSVCSWRESAKPSKEWEVWDKVLGSEPPYYISQDHNPSDEVRVNFSYKGKTRSVVIKANGDSFIE